jgi:hypothetical protein
MSKPLAFISYIHEDEDFVIQLRDWIRDALLDGLDFFIAGDLGSIPLGSEWPEKISSALRRCSVSILILSPQSIDRKWLYFEAGAAFARKVQVIPVCCNGLNKSDLTPPLSFLQAVQLPNIKDEAYLLSELAQMCGLKSPRNPPSFVLKAANIVSPPPSKEPKDDGIMSILFDDKRLSGLILEWRDKILKKIVQLQSSRINQADAKKRLMTYLQRLTQEREIYVRESEQQIKTLPETMKQEHPEGGLHVDLAIAGVTSTFADYIKSSKGLLEILPEIMKFCGESTTTLETIAEYVKSRFDELLFQME